jgi:thiol-disulfide isomerase/thioredoxin
MQQQIAFNFPVTSVSPSKIRDPSMVLMYTDTCPHCRGYAPIYQQVANQLQPKLPQLKFYAINASTAPLRSEITRAGFDEVTAVPYLVLVTQDASGKKTYTPINTNGMLLKRGDSLPSTPDSPEAIARRAASMYITASNLLRGRNTSSNPQEVLNMFLTRRLGGGSEIGKLMTGENLLFGGACLPLETKAVDNMSDNMTTENVTQPEVVAIEGGAKKRRRSATRSAKRSAKRHSHDKRPSHRRSHRRRSASRSKSPKRHRRRMAGGAVEAEAVAAAPEVAEAIVGGAAPAVEPVAIVEGGAKKRRSTKRRSGSAKRSARRRSPNLFAKSMAKARRALGIKGFVPMRKSGGGEGRRLYDMTMKLYKEAK